MSPALKKINSTFLSGLGPDSNGSRFYTKGTRAKTLPQMKDMFETSSYASLTDFVRDVRSMLECHIRYNGPEHSVSRYCEKLETIMQQRIALLPRLVARRGGGILEVVQDFCILHLQVSGHLYTVHP